MNEDRLLLALGIAWERAVASRELWRMARVERAVWRLSARNKWGEAFYGKWNALTS